MRALLHRLDLLARRRGRRISPLLCVALDFYVSYLSLLLLLFPLLLKLSCRVWRWCHDESAADSALVHPPVPVCRVPTPPYSSMTPCPISAHATLLCRCASS